MPEIPNSLKSRIAKLVALAPDDRGNEQNALDPGDHPV